MLDKIILFSIRNKLFVGLFTLMIIIWGIWGAIRLPIDAVPDITNNQVQIITRATSFASQEVEQYVTYPIEQTLLNLPDIEEVRSISRFGLSVVTVVFKDDVDIYFARQLIHERLQQAIELIPESASKPEMAPVSTGLGEVYQYILHPKEGSEDKYSAMDLRTMQDWVVSRQLYGLPGVAEVNSFGGLVKQYEVSLNPQRLHALGVTIPEIVEALDKNNENTGGAYIDKHPNSYYIRGIGAVHSLEEVGNIVIRKTELGVPILIRDVAEVRYGHAVRYGAVTRNGEKEVVGGIVMMRKGANSAEVVNRVKEKMKEISKSLPDDVVIEPFLDRTNLVKRAMHTVEKNLIEGALIVIFVLVIFLGNLRAGLVVASAIPLSMLFALGMMHLFGVSANLMSLGAIDFGLIVDGAVIIVEAVMHHLGLRKSTHTLSRQEMDNEVYQAASKIRNSAAFGEIIILMVYIPVWTLTGIEGKMFRPMAQTVCFALLGALILSVTYVPMMCALCLPRKQQQDKQGISARLMSFLESKYIPLVKKAIVHKYKVIATSILLFIVSIWGLSRLGGEFIPVLEEGDFAFHCILPPGTSLQQSIETSMQASKIIRSFPEVKEVVGKTGTAEIPTDPMPPEASDLVIILKPQTEWTTTKDYFELARLIEQKLATIPGVLFEVNQPIQMRFNELMTGVRQDVAIKIFGEDVLMLKKLADETAALIQSIPGVSTPQVEKTTGLPQISVQYDRIKLAGYGLRVADLNDVLETAFAGKVTGPVFENERKFDLVVRLDAAHRQSIEDVENLFVPMHDGSQIPLKQVADIKFSEGPAQISREEGKRRIVIGFNVQDRDVKSVIADVRELIEQKLTLPEGYHYTFGGTYKNMEQALSRLMLVVPLALLLIGMMLYLTFHSLQQALLVFTAIPMSAIGGIAALMIRGMPFSISAAIGFIALFGVAVLNGIVLIATMNQLAKEGIIDPVERVLKAVSIRLRPVLMTATVASLGFFPMAMATSTGAEVQKPLATVVIGGLVSATLLTLFVLPILYLIFQSNKVKIPKPHVAAILLIFSQISFHSYAQTPSSLRISLQAALDSANRHNTALAVSKSELNYALQKQQTVSLLSETGFFYENEDITPLDQKGILKIGVQQSINWPGIYRAQRKEMKAFGAVAQANLLLSQKEIEKEVTDAYYLLWYWQEKLRLYQTLDTLYEHLYQAARIRVTSGEAAAMEMIAASSRKREVDAYIESMQKELLIQQYQLKKLMQVDYLPLPIAQTLPKIAFTLSSEDISTHPVLQAKNYAIESAEWAVKSQQLEWFPDFSGRFFSQRLYGVTPPFSGFSVTMSLPIVGASQRAKVKSAKLEKIIKEKSYEDTKVQLLESYQRAKTVWEKNKILIAYYEETGLYEADELIRASKLAYTSGEISYTELSQYLTQAIKIQEGYLDALREYNQSVISLLYFTDTNSKN